MPSLLGEAQRGGNAGIGDRHDHIGIDRRFARQFAAHGSCALRRSSGRRASSPAARNRCIRRCRAAPAASGRAAGYSTPSSEITTTSPFSISRTNLRADDVERAGFRAEDIGAVQFAEDQRADAEGIARADELLVGQRHQRIGAFERAQRIDVALDDARLLRAGHEMQDHFGVGGRLADAALGDQLAAQRQAVGEVAIVGDGEAAGGQFGEQRLHIAQDGFAGGRIAHMAQRHAALQPADDLGAGEVIADQAEAALGLEALAVEGDDAGRFLAAVLEGMQAEGGQRRRVGMAVDAEYAAFLAQPVAVQFEIECRCSLAVALSECRLLRVAARFPRIRFSSPWFSLFW